MDNSALRETLQKGEWSIEYNESFTKQTKKAVKTAVAVVEMPGRAVQDRDKSLMEHVLMVAEQNGWRYKDGTPIHVAHGAMSYRSPAPRFDVNKHQYRTSVACYKRSDGQHEWRILEEKADLKKMANLQAKMEDRCHRLVSFFTCADPKAT